MVDGGSEAIDLKAKSLFMLGRWKNGVFCITGFNVQARLDFMLLHISQAWRGSGILSQSSEGGRYAFNIGLEIKILGIFHYSILFQHHQELDIKGGAKK